MRTRVKICGITRQQDAKNAVQNGADAIGLVFYEASPRAVDITQAKQIITALPPFVTKVGLFVDAKPELIHSCLAELPMDLLQFHGDEQLADCEQFDKPYIKAVRMRENTSLKELSSQYRSASALLLDSYQPGIPGGTGTIFDWSLINEVEHPVILAGGLTPANVKMAIQQVSPYAVDVSGGVEAAKGIKDNDKISAFMKEVANA